MTVALDDERLLLRRAVGDALAGHDLLAAARAALDGKPLPDLWPVAAAGGWPGLVCSESAGGAGLGAAEAMVVGEELGRRLAPLPLAGHWAAAWLLEAGGGKRIGAVAAGEARAVLVDAQRHEPDHDGVLTGSARWVPGAAGAQLLVVLAGPHAYAVPAGHVRVQPVAGYDATRLCGHVELAGVRAAPLEVTIESVERARCLQHGTHAAEAIGSARALLDLAVGHARQRRAFGRPIGSFQAVKHQLVEILRRLELARALLEPAADAWNGGPVEELVLQTSALRQTAGTALDCAAATALAVLGGLGATWDHDAQLHHRRAQLDRRLLGGTAEAARRVGEILLRRASAGDAAQPGLS